MGALVDEELVGVGVEDVDLTVDEEVGEDEDEEEDEDDAAPGRHSTRSGRVLVSVRIKSRTKPLLTAVVRVLENTC